MRSSALVLAFLALPLAAAAPPPAPVARTEALIAAFQAVKPDDGKLTAADRRANELAFAALDSFFDFETLTTEPIRPHRAKFTAAQRQEFAGKFRELIRLVAYPGTGAFFRKAKRTVGVPRDAGDARVVDVELRVPEEDLATTVSFHWKPVGGTLRLVDVDFDGDSLVRDYRNQFGRIVDKDGAAGLLKRADEKLAELRKAARN
jgi:ABC-type transporter MlaC component